MARHFLYLTNSRLVSLVARGRRIAGRREFEVEAGATPEFEAHLRAHRRAPTHLFTDLAEEDFRLDTIPHVGARDREAILNRKLSQVYRTTPFRQAIVQGREREGRKDDRVLYTAISNPEVLQPWLEAIERLEVPLVGIHSSAAFSGKLLAALQLEFPHTLLVTFTPGEAIRQTYFRDREVRFSRLTPIDLAEGEDLGTLVTEETTRTYQYLDSLRNFGDADTLEVIVLAHPKDRPALEPHLRDFGQIRYRLLDIEQVAATLGMKPPPLTSSAEGVLAHLFLRRRSPNDFAGAELRRNAVLRNARLALNVASGLVLAVGLAWGLYALSNVVKAEAADFARQREVGRMRAETERILRSLPVEGMGGTAMREVVAFYTSSLRDHPSPVEFLLPVTQVLQAHSRIRVLQVSWQSTADLKAAPPLTPMSLRDQAPIRSLKRGTEASAPAPTGEAAEVAFSERRHGVALLEASVRVLGGDYRGAVSEAETFANSLAAMPGYSAELVESPLDTRPALTVQGKILEREPASGELRFVVRIARAGRSPS